jgi:hypothetical protein
MASVFRQDTGELIGYLIEPQGPFPGGITYWPFKAWRHSDGKLRSEPEPGTDEAAPDTLDIPVQNNASADVHLIVPLELVDFIVTHKAFRSEPPPPPVEDAILRASD